MLKNNATSRIWLPLIHFSYLMLCNYSCKIVTVTSCNLLEEYFTYWLV